MANFNAFFATTAKGMEEVLAEEISALPGASEVKIAKAGVSFKGTLETAYRACLWSRIANRILLPLGKFQADTPERLYGGVKGIRWSDHISPKETLAVDFSSTHSQITHTHFGALKVKDAIVDQIRSIQGERPSVNPLQPDVRINVYVANDEATVSIDLSGESLHKRGYREDGANAPLKENLAAAILMLAGWHKLIENSRKPGAERVALVDPMCGSGTLPIEAALMAARIAPGTHRSHFGFLGWLGHDPVLWKKVLDEAHAGEIRDPKKLPKIIGTDRDPAVIHTSLANLERAGVEGLVHFEKKELTDCAHPGEKSGIIVVNPPYGERLGEEEELIPLYRLLGDTFKKKFTGWEGYVFTGNPELAKNVGLKASRRFVLFNGPIECRLLKFELFSGSKETKKTPAVTAE